MLVDRTVRDVLAAFASPAPAPGGGSASALAGALGASLLLMVARMTKTRDGTDADRAALAEAAAALVETAAQLTTAVDEDAVAYEQVVAAYRLPKDSGAAQARQEAIQRALVTAIDVPLRVMRLAAGTLRHGETVAAHGYRAAASDVGVGAALLGVAVHGARLNVDVNLDGVSDESYVAAVKRERDEMAMQADASARRIDRIVSGSAP